VLNNNRDKEPQQLAELHVMAKLTTLIPGGLGRFRLKEDDEACRLA